ncbi:hypothetical protein F4861DRAFT_393418 [Xylaria intraflava]|nr:hypothetical protein F4861DRAFT_393418 [Xylaria intraflava]
MSMLCCCHHRQPVGKATQTEAIELPMQPPRATLSKTLSRSETDMYLSSILASRAPSQLITPTYQSIVDPDAVDVEDSDDDALESSPRQSNMSTLRVFQTKLIRRFSHRVDVKAGSQPSVGTSDEELARRAELKRLMHKRIQAELKSEEEEDDEANDNFKLASLKQVNISSHKEPELPGGGPRDGIEFSVCGIDEKGAKNEANTSLEASPLPAAVANEPQSPWRKENSRSGSVKRSADDSSHEYISLDETGSIVQPPSPSHLAPVHLLGEGGRRSPSTASWCPSYSAVHMDGYIEPLVGAGQNVQYPSQEPKDSLSLQEDLTTHSQEADTTSVTNQTLHDEIIGKDQTMNSEEDSKENNQENSDFCTISDETSNERYSPLDVWLWSQELQCTSILSSCSNSEMAFEYLRRPDVRERIEDSVQYDTSANLTADISIPQGHASRAGHRSPETSANEEKPSVTATSNESLALNQVLNQVENVIPSEGTSTKDQAQDISSRYTSSRYTTKSHSQQATPGGSRLSLSELPGNRKTLQPLTTIHGPINSYHATASDKSGTSSYRTALNKTPSSDHPKIKLEGTQLPMAEVVSINASETASYRQREEELKSVKKRFGLTPARRHPIIPVRSKFREEFEDLKGSSGTRGSILSKIYLALPRKIRRSSSQTESSKSNDGTEMPPQDCQKLERPHSPVLESNGERLLSLNIAVEALPEEKTAGLWQRAMNPGGVYCAGRLKTKLIKTPIPKTDIGTTEPRPASKSNQPTENPRVHEASEERGVSAKHSQSPPRKANISIPNEDVIHDTADIHSGVLQEWVEQLHAEDAQRQSRAGSRGNGSKPQPPRLRTPPESWAKWPSHTREERTASAREYDRVITRDFAITTNSNPLATGGGRDKISKGKESTASSRTLPSQVGKALKLGWNKMIIYKDSLGRAPGHVSATQGARVSQEFLEYPELELLPTAEGYREVQAIEQQIDSMKRRSASIRGATRLSSSESAKSPLASRIAEEVHKIRPEGESIAWADIEFRAKSPQNKRFLTPTYALVTPRAKSHNPDPTGTAAPHCIYEECVQTQMLDEDDEDNKYACQDITIKRARSTGNIDIKLSSGGLPTDEEAHNDQAPIHKTLKSGLRRHKSLGFLTRAYDGTRDKSRDKSASAEKASLN